MSDGQANGQRLKCLTVADDFSISGEYVTRLLDRAAVFRGDPSAVCTDSGREFTSRTFMAWAQGHGVRHILIQPGRPMQNGYIESVNGRFREECATSTGSTAPGAHGHRNLAAGLQRGPALRQHRAHPTRVLRRAASPATANNRRDHVTFNQDFCRNIGTAEGDKSDPRLKAKDPAL